MEETLKVTLRDKAWARWTALGLRDVLLVHFHGHPFADKGFATVDPWMGLDRFRHNARF